MQPRVAFCNRCRGMRVGWNRRYVLHRILCKQWLHDSSRLGSLAVLMAVLLVAFPEPNASVLSADRPRQPVPERSYQTAVMSVGPAVLSMEAFLKNHGVGETNCVRLASSIVNSARKYNLDPRLIASIVIVESRGNPFAISGKDAIGIMQIHLPTWGYTADREGINLLKIEDNIDFGTRILKNYLRQFGVWEGVKRYNGFFVDDRTSEQSAQAYVEKVQRVYEFQQPAASEPDLLLH
jgi:soluble lytic murein transglycosylase-like protein